MSAISIRLMPVVPFVVAALAGLLVWYSGFVAVPTAEAASARELDVRVDEALNRFVTEVKGGRELLRSSKGALVMPKVYKAGIGFGGEYGEGALRIGGRTMDYYNVAAGSWGFQLGAQKKTIVLLFMQDQALQSFRNSSGWKAGVDASVAIIKVGKAGEIDTKTVQDPVLGFVFDQRGLMYDLSLEGAKFTRLNKH